MVCWQRNLKRALLTGVLLLLVAALLVACDDASIAANQTALDNEIGSSFQSFYRTYDGDKHFGQVLSGPLLDPTTGREIQYFGALRLEFDRTLPVGQQVFVTPLGLQAYADAPKPALSEDVATEEIMLWETFRAFYMAAHGSTLLGQPIAAAFIEDERWVQYFENGRLEYYPTMPPSHQVQFTQLGTSHYWDAGVFLHRVQSSAIPRASAGLTRVVVSASVARPIVYGDDPQQLMVKVTTPAGYPVEDIDIVVLAPDAQAAVTGQTNQLGVFTMPIDTAPYVAGQWVEIQLQVINDQGVIGEATVRFQRWW